MDSTMNEGNNSFPVDRPVEALLRDHQMVRTLVESYRNTDSDQVKINAAEQILMLLETHSLLEEGVFYPGVRDVNPEMIDHFEQEHQKTDEMLAELKRISLSDPQAFTIFEQVVEATLHHIEEEENEFFPQLEQANMDMTPLGLQMQAHEANLAHIQAQANQQGARR
ncbi:hemerythrin domain-containing protein [Noviherbaspirillum aridicola]|uniref:Hemerythrin-like domain-containing protein n=1 Tax=Noviherbaspirillum aridicola TaxID=2849687 RepID=A0ABQ4QAU9_9BURK|nr:hemerythrin domain-containing protein [Noviherbaspirillum aridicola]GIZ53930.1 hypothetical protein NCCP691_39440 [Noviherbaspirillum aridicola]